MPGMRKVKIELTILCPSSFCRENYEMLTMNKSCISCKLSEIVKQKVYDTEEIKEGSEEYNKWMKVHSFCVECGEKMNFTQEDEHGGYDYCGNPDCVNYGDRIKIY